MKIKRVIAAAVTILTLCSGIRISAAQIDAAGTGYDRQVAVVAAEYAEVGTELEPDHALPSSYSSRAEGLVTPVRFQRFNTCWAYSSAAALETLMIKNQQQPLHLSTMHMNYWGCTNEQGNGWQRQFGRAGYPYIAMGYLTSFGALMDYEFPDSKEMSDYTATLGHLYPHTSVNSIIYLKAQDPDTVKTAVYRYGAAVGNFHYDSNCQNAAGTAYCCDIPGYATRDLFGHAIEIVGWDDSYAPENFNPDHMPSSPGAWLCKNSWGTVFGDSGYFWISYEDQYLFDSRFGPSYAIMGYSDMTAIDQIKQNEIYGSTYEFNYVRDCKPRMNRVTYANVLDFSDGYHNIDKVIFESTSVGSRYSVYYIPTDENDIPDDDASTWILLGEGTVEYQGYISVDAGGISVAPQKGAIGVQIFANSNGDFGIGSDEWLSSNDNYLFKPDSTYGQSYLIGYDIQSVDVMDFFKNEYDDEIGSTFVIKALCHSDETVGDVDSDEDFNIIDVTLTQRMLAAMIEFNSRQMRFADYDNDCEVNIIDCTLMQRALCEL